MISRTLHYFVACWLAPAHYSGVCVTFPNKRPGMLVA